MKVLVVGAGGREHALAWKLHQSESVTGVYVAPGNPGTKELATAVPIPADDIPDFVQFARDTAIDLTVVGPDNPLANGIVDQFQLAGLKIFGPTKASARLESSKSFAKEFMARYGIASPGFAVCDSVNQAIRAVERFGFPYGDQSGRTGTRQRGSYRPQHTRGGTGHPSDHGRAAVR